MRAVAAVAAVAVGARAAPVIAAAKEEAVAIHPPEREEAGVVATQAVEAMEAASWEAAMQAQAEVEARQVVEPRAAVAAKAAEASVLIQEAMVMARRAAGSAAARSSSR